MLKESDTSRPAGAWEVRIRIAFWIVGIATGALLTYTSRFFLNSDAVVYIEMGEAFAMGEWSGLVNFTFSPGYPILLGITQAILGTDPVSELILFKGITYLAFVAAMAACDLLMGFVKSELRHLAQSGEDPFPIPLVTALCYLLFLIAGLIWIRVRLMNPDMLILALTLVAASILLWIRKNPDTYGRYVLLGLTTGIGYLTKYFFFMFSPALLLAAGWASGSVRKAVPRVLLCAVVMLAVSAPLIAALSHRMGRFTYAEGGRFDYALLISGQGEPTNPPKQLYDNPKVLLYDYELRCSRPSAHDPVFWALGREPKIDIVAHVKHIIYNIWLIFEQTPWLTIIILWFALQWALGSFKVGSLSRPSAAAILALPGLCGITLFSLIYMHVRYIAPFLFLTFTGLLLGLRYPPDGSRARKIAGLAAVCLAVFVAGLLVHSVVDQSFRGLRSTEKKLSYKAAFLEQVAVKDFLEKRGVGNGRRVATVGTLPTDWARMARVRIVGEVPLETEWWAAGEKHRSEAVKSLERADVVAIVGRGSAFDTMTGTGWEHVPGTKEYYICRLNSNCGMKETAK